jgi:hypothetical protein
MNDLVIVDNTGTVRHLGKHRPTAQRLAGFQKFRDTIKVVPKKDWKVVSRQDVFDASWIEDQNGYSSCVSESTCSGVEKSIFLNTQSRVRLSRGVLYAQINGGRDQGAFITDALDRMKDTGTCLWETSGRTPFFKNQIPREAWDEAKRFTISEAYHLTSFEEMMSAIQLGYLVVFGFMVGSATDRLDQYGVAGHVRGPGNHAVHADGCNLLPDGRWVLDMVNSWSVRWGRQGRAYLDEKHFQGIDPDAFAIRAVNTDPNNLPVAA